MRKIEDKVSVAKMLVYFEITKLVEWYMQVRQQLVAQFVVVNLTQQVAGCRYIETIIKFTV